MLMLMMRLKRREEVAAKFEGQEPYVFHGNPFMSEEDLSNSNFSPLVTEKPVSCFSNFLINQNNYRWDFYFFINYNNNNIIIIPVTLENICSDATN